MTSVIELFERSGETRVDADFTSAPKVQARILAGELADVVIASNKALNALEKESRILSTGRTVIGRTGMAVAMRKGATIPDLSSTEAFRRAMLEVDLLAYNQGSSGIHAAAVLDQLGLRELLGSKIHVVQNGAEMFELITSLPGRVVGLANITNILDQIAKGAPVALAAPLPGDLQHVTTYEAAVATSSTQAALSTRFVSMFATAKGRRRLASAGVN